MTRASVTTLLLVVLAIAGTARAADPTPTWQETIENARARVVKIYGATVGREKSYASGVIVSADGQIVATLSLLLEARSLRVVLADGRTYPAKIERRDPVRQLALLKTEADALPHFDLEETARAQVGDWVIAAANPFNVAVGDEPVSVSIGTLSGETRLAGRYRSRDLPYEGTVLLTDIIVSAPGSAGGALLDINGVLLGVIGKPAISEQTNTWVNYAIPATEVAAFVRGDISAPATFGTDATAGLTPAEIGLHLFDVGGRVRPAYIERVQHQSPAARAGLRPNDLIVSIAGEAVQSCDDVPRLLRNIPRDKPLAIVVKRGDEVLTLTITPEQPAP